MCFAGAALAVFASACASAGHATAAVQQCSAEGLRFSYQSHGATFSDQVQHLTAKSVSCGTARAVAATVARRLLHHRDVQAGIDGFQVMVRSPCPSCTPVWHVTATASQDRAVAFQVHGGG